ncbi:MAG: Hsp33 family molecular chaperone HslO [Deltaproteobacteria bacterium]|nr:Hsp33 family molecular chaperone HslO [Deltaproteobacteria bacterium]
MKKQAHLAHYYRYLWEEPGLVVVVGAAAEISKGFQSYNARYGVVEDDRQGHAQLERLFAGAGLAAVSLAERESWGWSVSLPGSETGLFCAVEPEGMVCGRCLASSKKEKQTVVVQRQKENVPLAQSFFSLQSDDPLQAVERYFEEAEQSLVRVAIDDTSRGILIRPLPGGSFDIINGLSDAELIEQWFRVGDEPGIKKLEEVVLFYECRCNDELILNMLTSLPEKQRREMWHGRSTLDVQCPRCARRFSVNRKQ